VAVAVVVAAAAETIDMAEVAAGPSLYQIAVGSFAVPRKLH
jgi:hypothetical protein